MLVGYARTSTAEQAAGLDAQIRDLTDAGCERVFKEQVSAAGTRNELTAAIVYVREGDVLVATKPDRLARSVADLLFIVGELQRKGVGLRILSMGGQEVDTQSPTGRLMLTMLGAVAEFERALMLERQREGIAVAKAQGRFKGRVPTARRKAPQILALRAEGHGATEIARRLGVSRASVHRVLADQENDNDRAGQDRAADSRPARRTGRSEAAGKPAGTTAPRPSRTGAARQR